MTPDKPALRKYLRDGKVAVLVSPGFGAGWATWADDSERAAFDDDLVRAVLGEGDETPLQVAERKFPDEYHGGIRDLTVQWVPEGTGFDIREYDGSESLELETRPWPYRA